MSLASLLLWLGALPLWTYLIVGVGRSPGFGWLGFIVAPITLVVATAAFFRLFHDLKNGLAISALLAGVVLASSLLIVAAISG